MAVVGGGKAEVAFESAAEGKFRLVARLAGDLGQRQRRGDEEPGGVTETPGGEVGEGGLAEELGEVAGEGGAGKSGEAGERGNRPGGLGLGMDGLEGLGERGVL